MTARRNTPGQSTAPTGRAITGTPSGMGNPESRVALLAASNGAPSPRLMDSPAYHRQIERLHVLGPRAFAELLDDIAGELGARSTVLAKVQRFAELDLEALRVVGADRLPPAPLMVLPDPGWPARVATPMPPDPSWPAPAREDAR